MNAPTLFKITAAVLPELQAVEASDLPEDAMRDTLEGLRWPIEQKARDVIAFSLTLQAQAKMIEERERELAARRKRLEGRAAWFRAYALEAMRAAKIDKLDSVDFTARVRENPGSVVVDDEALLPPELIREKVIREVDKATIRERLLAGQDVPGARLYVGWRLDIR